MYRYSQENTDAGPVGRGERRPLWLLFLVALLLPAVSPLAAAGSGFHDHQAIRDTAASFLEEKTGGHAVRPEIDVGRLDERLNLAACAAPLDTFLPPGSRLVGNVTVGVRCAEPRPWTIYVSASIRMFDSIVVANRPLMRGETLKKSDLTRAEVDLARYSSGYMQDIEAVIGKQLKSAVSKGNAITPRLLEAPRLVRRGERVIISATGKGIDVRMHGKALMDGTEGERIRVRNSNSRRVIEATVASPGMVEVRM